MNVTALRTSEKIIHAGVKILLFSLSGIIALCVIYFSLWASGSVCDRCDERYYGKCADDVDGVKICDRCVSMKMWQARQYLGGDYLRHEKVDARLVKTYRALVTGNLRYFDEQARGRT